MPQLDIFRYVYAKFCGLNKSELNLLLMISDMNTLQFLYIAFSDLIGMAFGMNLDSSLEEVNTCSAKFQDV